jgi:hypothetical protein
MAMERGLVLLWRKERTTRMMLNWRRMTQVIRIMPRVGKRMMVGRLSGPWAS